MQRPRQLKLDGVKPCVTLTAAQQQQFKTHNPKESQDEGLNSPSCDFHLMDGDLAVVLVTNDSADSWTNGSRPGQAMPQASIEGFPTVGHSDPLNPGSCDVIVDTADGQYLVGTAVSDRQNQDTCPMAHQVAEAAMQTLLAGR